MSKAQVRTSSETQESEQRPEAEAQPFDRPAAQARSLAFARSDAAELGPREQTQATADRGVDGPGRALPHGDVIQASFGRHDVSGIQAHVGGQAAAASRALGADAYATGDQVAFRDQPDLHTAAHEAAHVVQQQQGVQLHGGLGPSDAAAEQHADQVADRVVSGSSAEELLDQAPMVSGGIHRKEADAGTLLPQLEITPRTVAFGSQVVGEVSNKYVQVKNTGDHDAHITNATVFGGAGFMAFLAGKHVLAPGEQTLVQVTFRPAAPGTTSGMVFVHTANGTAVSFQVTGTANNVQLPQLPGAPAPGPQLQPAGLGPLQGPQLDSSPQMDAVDDPSELVSRPEPAPLEATPGELKFGENIQGDVGNLIEIRNTGSDVVYIDDIHTLGRSTAVTVELLDGINRVDPGDSVRIAVTYSPDKYAGAQSTIDVITQDGQHLYIPVSGPPALDLSSGDAALDVEPAKVQFPGTSIGDISPAVGLRIRNRNRLPARLDKVEIPLSSPFHASPLSTKVVPGGETAFVDLNFLPIEVGTKKETAFLLAPDGAAVGFFDMTAEGMEAVPEVGQQRAQGDDQQGPDAAPPVATCGQKNKDELIEVMSARADADKAFKSWQGAATKSISSHSSVLRNEWTKYLGMAGSNPSITSVQAGGPSFLRGMMSNAFGNILAAAPENLAEKAAGKIAKKALKRAGGAAAGGGAGAAVGSVAGPPGVVVGFVVGVLVETAASLLFDALFPDDSVNQAIQEAFEEGATQGEKAVADLILSKHVEIDTAEQAAEMYQVDKQAEWQARINASCDPYEIDALSAQMEVLAEDFNKVKPKAGLADKLLALWVKNHAASPTSAAKDVYKAQWKAATKHLSESKTLSKEEKAQFGEGKIKSEPDLFVSQFANELTRRGLPLNPALFASIRSELGVGEEQSVSADAATKLAQNAKTRFGGREFVFSNLKDLDAAALPMGVPKDGTLACTLELDVKDGCCYVKNFFWAAKQDGGWVNTMKNVPGGKSGYPHVDDREPSHFARGGDVYGVMSQLEALGAAVRRDPDAAEHSWLQDTFGKGVAIPITQGAEGGVEKISVFRATTKLGVSDAYTTQGSCKGSLQVPDEQWKALRAKFPWAVSTSKGNYEIWRAGNTILILELCSKYQYEP